MQKQKTKVIYANQPSEGEQVLNKTMNMVGNTAQAVVGTGLLAGTMGIAAGALGGGLRL